MSVAMKNATRFEKLNIMDQVGLFYSNDPTTEYPDAPNGSLCIGSANVFEKLSGAWVKTSIVPKQVELDVEQGNVGTVNFADSDLIIITATIDAATINGIVDNSSFTPGKRVLISFKADNNVTLKNEFAVSSGEIAFKISTAADLVMTANKIYEAFFVQEGATKYLYIQVVSEASAAGPVYTFVFDPAIPASADNIYKTFSELYSAFDAMRGKGKRVIEYKDGGSGVTIPAGSYPGLFDNVTHRGIGTYSYEMRAGVTLAAGVTGTGFTFKFENINLTCNNTVAPVLDANCSGNDLLIIRTRNFSFDNSGTKAFISLRGASGGIGYVYTQETFQLASGVFIADGDENYPFIYLFLENHENLSIAANSFSAISTDSAGVQFIFDNLSGNNVNVSFSHTNMEVFSSGLRNYFIQELQDSDEETTLADADILPVRSSSLGKLIKITWGNFKVVIQAALADLFVPTGSYKMMAGRSAPNSAYYICDGTNKTRSSDLDLFNYLNESIGNPTLSIASPCVVTLNNHGLQIGERFFFETSGALPTNVSANTEYYVLSSGYTANSFQFAASAGGSAINSSGTQSGVHTLRASPHGIANSTTFKIPDARGLVMVGAGAHGTMTRASGTAYNGGLAGATRNDQMQGHQHYFDEDRTLNKRIGVTGGGANAVFADSAVGTGTMKTTTPIADSTNGTPRTGDETRPAEIAALVCIKR